MRGATASLPEALGPESDRAADLAPGARLGSYELVAALATGGTAQVWTARHVGRLGFTRLVALKAIRPEYAQDAAMRTMFLEEARLAARLRHTNVVDVLDLGEQGAVVFLVMMLVDGDSLAGLLRRWKLAAKPGGLPAPIAVRILADAARGLHAAHELCDDEGTALGLVHRDMSPQNILVGLDGVGKIADFGIAKAFGRLTEETEAGQRKGKLAYMSPEQAAGRTLRRQSDIFSAGVVLWETLTGARLFRADAPEETLERVLTLPIPDPAATAPIHAAVARVAMKALARDPGERYATAEAMADALETAALASGTTATARDVALLVAELVGRDVARGGERVSSIPRQRTLEPPVRGSVVIGKRMRAVAAGLAMVGVLAAMTTAAFVARRVHAAATPATPATPAGAASATGAEIAETPALEGSTLPARRTDKAPASPGAEEPAAGPAAGPRSAPTVAARIEQRDKSDTPGRSTRPAPPAGKPRPPFANPYGR